MRPSSGKGRSPFVSPGRSSSSGAGNAPGRRALFRGRMRGTGREIELAISESGRTGRKKRGVRKGSAELNRFLVASSVAAAGPLDRLPPSLRSRLLGRLVDTGGGNRPPRAGVRRQPTGAAERPPLGSARELVRVSVSFLALSPFFIPTFSLVFLFPSL